MILTTVLARLDSLAATGQVHRLGWVVIHSVWQAAAVERDWGMLTPAS